MNKTKRMKLIMKRMMCILSIALFLGCHQNKNVSDTEKSIMPSELEAEHDPCISLDACPSMSHKVYFLDSLLASLYVDADPASKARHAWEWVRQTRIALDKTEEPMELDSLNALSFDVDKLYAPLTAGSPSESNEAAGIFAATATFRLLNAYQVLANQLSESLDEDWFFQDYKLWENVYREYERSHDDAFGRSTTYMLCIAHKALSELRRSILMEELGYLSFDRNGAAEWYVNADEIQWSSTSRAIRPWFEHRMKMADTLQKVNKNHAEYFRRMTYKIVFLLNHFQLNWNYDFEKI